MQDRDIFLSALDIESPEQRSVYLEEACGDDEILRSRVESLLRAAEVEDSFLERPVLGDFRTEAVHGDTTPDDAESHGELNTPLDFLTPADDASLLGRLGQFQIQEILGQGGMGIVLKAHDPRLNRTVAIKVLAPQFAANTPARRRFLREAQAAAAVTHPHVVTIHAVDENDKTPYLVMECVDGVSLHHKIDDRGALELKEILRIGSQIASGLAAAHSHGLIHRDIKPGNILLENGVERVKITDFGLARAIDDLTITRTGEVAGTPQYMSPEQATGRGIDHRSDLFSLGAVLYSMCTGRSAFRADNTMAVLHRVCNDSPRPIREVNPDIPRWLVEIVERLLAKDPDERFQSAEQVAELLGQCLAYVQHPTLAPKPPEITATALEKVAGNQETDAPSDDQALQKVTPSFVRGEGRDATKGNALARLPSNSWLLAGSILLLLIGLLGATEATGVTQLATTVIRLAQGEGVLVIEADDPDVEISIDGQDITISGGGVKQLKLRPGDYRVKACKDGKPIKTELVSIVRGGKETIRVSLESSPTANTLATNSATQANREGGSTAASDSNIHNALFDDALAAYTFEPDTLYEKDGQSYVRDVTGNGHDGRHAKGEQLAEGIAGAAMNMADDPEGMWTDVLVHDLSEFTIAGWIKPNWDSPSDVKGSLYRGVVLHAGEPVHEVRILTTQIMVYFGTSEGWKDFRPPVSWHKGEWNFIAFSWKQGTSDLGQLRVTVNEEQFSTMLPSMSKPARAALIASARPAGIDEVAIFKRALTDEDIVRLYKGGLAGKSLPEIFAGQLVQHAPPISGADAQRSSLAIREVGKFPGRRSVACVQFTPDGRFVLGACQDDLKVWETETGRLVRTMQAGEQILSLAVSPDGKHVVTGLNSTFELVLWDIASGEEIHRLAGHEERPYGLAFSADGTRLFSKGVDRTLREWDLEHGQPVKAYAQANGYNNLLRLIPGGDQLLTTSTDDGAMLGIFDVNSGAVVRKFLGSHRGQSRGLDMTTDGARAVTSSTEGILRIWDVAEGREVQQINTGDYQPYQVEFVPGGRFIVSGGIDETEGQWSVRLWDVMTGSELARWTSSEPTLTVAVANSGRYVATCGTHHDDKQGPARLLELPPSVWAPGDPDTEAGWVSLFNGRDLTGWKKHPDAPSGWTVEDGLLVGRGGPDTYLFSEHHDYKDFHLRVEAKVNDAGDSGVFLRSEFGLNGTGWANPFPKGYEVQLAGGYPLNNDHTGTLANPGKGRKAQNDQRVVPPDTWHTLDVIVRGGRFIIKVNGEVVVDYVDEASSHPTGHITLQASRPRGVVQFRNIEIRKLLPNYNRVKKAKELLAASKVEEAAALATESIEQCGGGFGDVADWDNVCEQIAEKRPQLTDIWKVRGEYYARRSQWEKAANDFQRAWELGRPIALELACVLILSGDRDGYAALSKQFVAKYRDEIGTFPTGFLSLIPSLGTNSGIDATQLEAWTKQWLEQNDGHDAPYRAGIGYLRAGRYEQAIECLTKAREDFGMPISVVAFPLALAHHGQEDHSHAKKWFDAGLEIYRSNALGDPDIPAPWALAHWLEFNVFYREAMSVMGEAMIKEESTAGEEAAPEQEPKTTPDEQESSTPNQL